MAEEKAKRQKIEPLHSSQIRPFLSAAKKGDVLKDAGSLHLIAAGDGKSGKWLFHGYQRGSGKKYVDLDCGHFPETSLSAARAKREEHKASLRQGINPNKQARDERQAAQKQEEEDSRTFAVVAEEYFELQKKKGRAERTISTDTGRVRNHVLPAIGSIPIVRLHKEHLKPIIDGLVNQAMYDQAERVARLIRSIFGFAEDAGYIETSPAERLPRLVPQGAKRVTHMPAITDRAGAAEMFKKLWRYFDANRSGPSITAAMKLFCYLPIRCGNMVAAEWKHIDLEKMVWSFPETKNKNAYVIPLTIQMRAVFDELRQYRLGKWCFPSGSKAGHISDGGLRKVLRMAGIPQEEHSLHGFRSLFKSLSEEAGLTTKLAERVLMHVAGDKVEQAYNRAQYEDPLRLALQWWCDVVDALRTDQPLPEYPQELMGKYQ